MMGKPSSMVPNKLPEGMDYTMYYVAYVKRSKNWILKSQKNYDKKEIEHCGRIMKHHYESNIKKKKNHQMNDCKFDNRVEIS
jgi:hypothetical protein